MSVTSFEIIEAAAVQMKVDLTAQELAVLAEKERFSEEMNAIQIVFSYLEEKKKETTIQTLLRLSRLPTKAPKTFENFNFNLLKGKDLDLFTDTTEQLGKLGEIYFLNDGVIFFLAGCGEDIGI